MFKKLIRGELSLSETFWKFGVLGMIFLTIIGKISNNILSKKLGKLAVVEYYTKYFSPLRMDSGVIAATIFNISAVLLLIFYSISMMLAVWRSSSKYDRSVWLRYISRFSMFLMIFICLYINL